GEGSGGPGRLSEPRVVHEGVHTGARDRSGRVSPRGAGETGGVVSGTTSIVSPRRGGRGVSGVPPVRYFRADAGQPFEKALSRRSQGAGRGSHGATESRRGTGLWGAVCGVGQRPQEDEADCPWGTQYCPWEPPAGSGARGGNPTRCSGPSGGVLDGCRARRSRRRLSAVSAPPASSARNNAFPGGSPAPLPGKRRSGGPAAP